MRPENIRSIKVICFEINMAQSSHIEWTDATWNPVTGCTKISPGCKNCYAERMAKRLKAMGQPLYAGSAIANLTVNGSLLFFTARDGIAGNELWALPLPVSAYAGGVPTDSLSGIPFTVTKASGEDLTLNWGDSSISSDTDYEIYEGNLGDFYSHTQKLRSTSGATSVTVSPSSNNAYYIVVPATSAVEGSYGKASNGAERPKGVIACRQQNIATCR